MKTSHKLLLFGVLSLFAPFASPAQAATIFRKELAPSEVQIYAAEIMRELPFIAQAGWGNDNVVYMLNNENILLNTLASTPGYREAAAKKPDLVSLQVDIIGQKEAKIRALKLEAMDVWEKEIASTLSAAASEAKNGQDVRAVIRGEIADRLAELSQRDPRALVNGMILAMPRAEQDALRKAGSTQRQISLLSESPSFTDAALRANFRPQAFGLAPAEVTRRHLLELADKMSRAEDELLRLIRTDWLLRDTAKKDLKALATKRDAIGEFVAQVKATDFQSFEEGSADMTAYIDSLLVDKFAAGDAKKKASGFLSRAVRAAVSDAFETTTQMVETVEDFLTVREVPPYMAIYRGIVGGDCSTGSSFAFPYSPEERDFYIIDSAGTFVGYISTTNVMMSRKRTLLVKDVTGRTMTAEQGERALNALYQALPALGHDRMAVTWWDFTNGQNHFPVLKSMLEPYAYGKRTAAVTFLDNDLRRTVLGATTGSILNYDSNEMHANGVVFKPNAEVLAQIRTIPSLNEKGTAIPTLGTPKTGAKAMLEAIDLILADESANPLAINVPGVETSELSLVAAVLRNSQGSPLETYYASVEAVFERFGIRMSKNFQREHANYFTRGHLAAANATTTSSKEMLDRTVDYVTGMIRRLPDPAVAYAAIQRNPAFFMQHPRFQELLNLLVERGAPADHVRLTRLAAIGVTLDPKVFEDPKFANLTWSVGTPEQKLALALRLDHEGHALNDQALAAVASALDNTQQPDGDDSLSEQALEILLRIRTTNATVQQELLTSATQEEDLKLQFRAGLAYILNGGRDEAVLEVLRDNAKSRKLSKEIKAQARETLKAIGDCGMNLQAAS